MVYVGQASITSEWLEKVPRGYAEALKDSHRKYKTGEQDDDPIRGRVLSW